MSGKLKPAKIFISLRICFDIFNVLNIVSVIVTKTLYHICSTTDKYNLCHFKNISMLLNNVINHIYISSKTLFHDSQILLRKFLMLSGSHNFLYIFLGKFLTYCLIHSSLIVLIHLIKPSLIVMHSASIGAESSIGIMSIVQLPISTTTTLFERVFILSATAANA